MKYYGPFSVLERVGNAAYKLELPEESRIHPTFHVSQLKPFHPDYTPVYSKLPSQVDLQAVDVEPESVLDHRLVKKGNSAIPLVRVKWAHLPEDSATWEDLYVLCQRFPGCSACGQAASPAGGGVTCDATDT